MNEWKPILRMARRSLIILAAVAVLSAAAVYGFQSLAETLKVSVDQMQGSSQELQTQLDTKRDNLQKVTKQARDLQTQLDKDGVTMSETDRKNKERELANLNREFQRQSREFREDLNLRRNEELGHIQERARKVIVDIGKTEKYDIIIEQAAVYVDPKSDITDRVMKALGSK